MSFHEQLEEVYQALGATRALDDLQAVITSLRDLYGVAHMVYHWVDSTGEQSGCCTYSPEWVARYIDRNYVRTDPVIIGCYRHFHPVDWKRLDWSSRAARAFQAEAIRHGVGNQGYSIPIRGPNGQFALFTVSDNCDDESWARFTDRHGRDLILIAHFFNRKALELAPGRTPEPPQQLSPREVEVMTFLAMGYSRSQVADMISISEHTLRAYIESARFKLGALNTTHAVARALTLGLIVA